MPSERRRCMLTISLMCRNSRSGSLQIMNQPYAGSMMEFGGACIVSTSTIRFRREARPGAHDQADWRAARHLELGNGRPRELPNRWAEGSSYCDGSHELVSP